MNIPYEGAHIDLTPPWTRISVKQAVMTYGNLSEEVFNDRDKAFSVLKN